MNSVQLQQLQRLLLLIVVFATITASATAIVDLNTGTNTTPVANPVTATPGGDFLEPLRVLMNLLSSNIAVFLAVFGLIGVGIAMIFEQGEMRNLTKSLVGIVVVACLMIFASKIVSVIFPAFAKPLAGSLLPPVEHHVQVQTVAESYGAVAYLDVSRGGSK